MLDIARERDSYIDRDIDRGRGRDGDRDRNRDRDIHMCRGKPYLRYVHHI